MIPRRHLRLLSCLAVPIVAALAAPILRAQCPDGSPAPCQVFRQPGIRPNVIAILPFRVSADPAFAYLRDGMVYLLAAEFNGDGVARAVDPDEVLRAVGRAGGASPLSRAQQLAVSRGAGAGQMLEGAIVGNARRITVTASILGVPRGEARVPTIVVEGSADSLAALAATLSARLAGRASGAWRLSATSPGTTSDSALRAYLAGHAARRARGQNPVRLFQQALAHDTTFVLAAYWLTMLRRLENGFPNEQRAFQLAWRQRDRLSPEQRLLLEAALGTKGPDTTYDRATIRRAVERATLALPNSFEAWYLFGDGMLHDGALLGYADWLPRARRAMEHALSLDTTASLLSHLVTVAFAERDQPRLARWSAAIERLWPGSPDAVSARYAAAVLSSSPAQLRAAREAQHFGSHNLLMPYLPSAERDSLLIRWRMTAPTARAQEGTAEQEYRWALNGGRPARAAEFRAAALGTDSLRAAVSAMQFMIDDSTDHATAARLLSAGGTRLMTLARCELALARIRRGDTTGSADAIAQLSAAPHDPQAPVTELDPAITGPLCATIVSGLAAALAPEGRAALLVADSVMRAVPPGAAIGLPHLNHDVALAFARRGEWKAAAASARRRLFARQIRLSISLRDEGRWAALAGDTASAIAAFRHFLLLRENAEPSLVPERDSIRAELERLTRRAGRGAAPASAGAGPRGTRSPAPGTARSAVPNSQPPTAGSRTR